MQLSLRPYMTAGVAIAGASVIAVTPITAPPAELDTATTKVSSAAVELTALDTSSWVDPLAYWGEVFATTQTNVGKLVDAASVDPFPVLNQVIENQTRRANTIINAYTLAAKGLFDWATVEGGGNLPTVLANAMNAIAEGDLLTAAQQIKFAITDFGIALYPMLPLLSMPYEVAQNLANAFKTMAAQGASTGIIGKPAFGLLNVASTAVGTAATFGQALIDAANDGDPVAALSTLINAPAFFTDSLLNGQEVVRPNGSLYRTTGLLTSTAVHFTYWSLGSALLVHIPQAIAAAITPPAPTTATVAPEVDSASTASDTALPTAKVTAVDADPKVNTSTGTVKELPRAASDVVNGVTQTATAALETVKSVTLKITPRADVRQTPTAANPSAEAQTTDTSTETIDEPGASEVDADKGSAKQTRKEARAAKREARQQAKAERQQARHEAKAAASTGGKHRADKKSADSDD